MNVVSNPNYQREQNPLLSYPEFIDNFAPNCLHCRILYSDCQINQPPHNH